MAEEAAKREFHRLINAQEVLYQELSRRLNIECLAVPACSLCLTYQDQEPHLLNAAGERIGDAGSTDSVAQMGFHCGQRGPQKQTARDTLYKERMERFKIRARKHAQQTSAAIDTLTKAGVDGSASGPARLQKREAIPSVDQWERKKKMIVEEHLMTSGGDDGVNTASTRDEKSAPQATLPRVGTAQSGNIWTPTSNLQPTMNAGLRQELQQAVHAPPPTSGWWTAPQQQQGLRPGQGLQVGKLAGHGLGRAVPMDGSLPLFRPEPSRGLGTSLRQRQKGPPGGSLP